MATILTQIIADKQLWLTARMQDQPLASFRTQLKPSQREFYQSLTSTENVFILECKKASPSKGLIRAEFDPVQIAQTYRQYANAISVLTDEKYFQGSFDYLTLVSNTVTQPVLCKDFIISPYQIYLARYYQADAILLMLSVLDDQQYIALADIAHQLNMGVLTEVSNQDELIRANRLQAKVIGINNRNLRDLSVNLETTKQLAPQLAKEVIVISESGIHHHQQVLELSSFVNGFLIGSALMAEDNLDIAIRKIIFGVNKVCGLTRSEDAQTVYQAGAIYGGLIFADRSPRCIDLVTAQAITQAVPLKWVGVFTDQSLEQITVMAKQLSLNAIQLHCHANQTDIDHLRLHLPKDCQIWLALSIDDHVPALDLTDIDHYLLDNGSGGTGQAFNWQILSGMNLGNMILAGGLNINNAGQAAELSCWALDFNSGLESYPGIKDHKKIIKLFQTLRLNKRQ